MARFEKGHGGRPKGAKNKRTLLREAAAKAAVATGTIVTSDPTAKPTKAQLAAAKRAGITILDGIKAKDLLNNLMRMAWERARVAEEEAGKMLPWLDQCEKDAKAAQADVDEAIAAGSDDADILVLRKALGKATETRDKALAPHREALRKAAAYRVEAGGWAKDVAPYEHPKLQSQQGNVDRIVNVIVAKF